MSEIEKNPPNAVPEIEPAKSPEIDIPMPQSPEQPVPVKASLFSCHG